MKAAALLFLRGIFTWILENWQFCALVAIGAALFYLGSQHTQHKWDKAVAAQTATQLAKNVADNEKLKQLQEKSNVESQDNLRLRANNHALWLRLPQGSCGGSSQTSSDTTTGAGELPTQSERDLAEAKRQLDDEALRADEVVRACRVLNGMN